MTLRVYLMPMFVGNRGGHILCIPKYIDLVNGSSCTSIEYGQELVCLFILDSSDDQHSALIANTDVRALPEDLDTVVTVGTRTQIVNALESLNVPAHWVANGQTFRIVLRRLRGIFQLVQNVRGRGLRFLQASLDSQISGLPANTRQALQDAATDQQLSTAGITNATTLRAALAAIGAQFDSRPIATRWGPL